MTDQVFCLNIDDTDMNYDEIYDPDIREFYDASTLPAQILNLEELAKPEVKNKVAVDTEFRTSAKTNNEYNVSFSLMTFVEKIRLLFGLSLD